MARPKKEGMDYFPHDTDAVNDEKIEALRMLYGNDGYAFYFILLERIYRTAEFELDISDAETIQILSRKIAISEDKFHQMLETALKRKIFDRDLYEKKKVLTSTGIKKRAEIVTEKREKMRKAYKVKVSDGEVTDIVSDAETTEETTPEMPQSKVKQSKEKESKENIDEKTIAPDAFEIIVDTFTNLLKNPTARVTREDIGYIRKLIEMGIPPDFSISIMQDVSSKRDISSMLYYFKAITERWNRLQNAGGEQSGLHSGHSQKDRDDGKASAGDGYYESFGFIKSVNSS